MPSTSVDNGAEIKYAQNKPKLSLHCALIVIPIE